MSSLRHDPARRQLGRLLMLAVTLASCGCAGYRFGTRSLYRPDIQSVYVPMFQSESFRPALGERLTEAVAKRIEQRTPYKVVSSPLADSTLYGRLISEQKQVAAENINDEPRNLDIEFVVEVNWVDRQGNPLLPACTIPLPPGALELRNSADIVPEAGQSVATGQQEVIDSLARQIVDQMEAPW